MFEREPIRVCETITGERAEVAVIGVYLVILGFELDPPELLLVLLVLKLLEPPDLPLVSDNSTIAIRTMVTINTVVNRIFVEFCKKSVLLRSLLYLCASLVHGRRKITVP